MRTIVLVVALWAAGLCAAAQFAKMGVPLAELASVYPQAGSAIGWLVSLISLLGIAFGLVAGIIGMRIGVRTLLLICLALGAAMSFLQALLPPFPVMLVLRIVEGLSHLGIVVAAPTLIGTLTPPAWRGAAMTLWGTFFGVAFAVTAWAGMPLVTAYGPAALILAHGIAITAVFVLLFLLLPAPDDPPPRADAASNATGLTGFVSRHRMAFSSAWLAAPALGWLFYTFTFVSLLTVLPQIVDPEARILVAGAMPLASIAVSMSIGVALLRFISAIGIVMIGFATGACIATTMAVVGVTPFMCIALFGALGLVQGASFAAIPQLNHDADSQSLANGAMAQMGNLGNMTGTPILLAILAAWGWEAMMVVVSASYILAIGVHATLSLRRSRFLHSDESG